MVNDLNSEYTFRNLAERDPAMSELGYKRIEHDFYETPEWMVGPIIEQIRQWPGNRLNIWEPACGKGAISNALQKAFPNATIFSSDKFASEHGFGNSADFLEQDASPIYDLDLIITNPPYGDGKKDGKLARQFIDKALEIARPHGARVMMLLRSDYSFAKNRRDLFGECQEYLGKLTFSKRPRWIAGTTGSPRHHYSWYFWSTAFDDLTFFGDAFDKYDYRGGE